MDETREALMEILEDMHPEVDFANETALIDDKILDSFDIVSLVTEIGDEFDVDVTAADLIPENFNSVEAMVTLIDRLIEEG